jgi:hypothetical protein
MDRSRTMEADRHGRRGVAASRDGEEPAAREATKLGVRGSVVPAATARRYRSMIYPVFFFFISIQWNVTCFP